MLRSRQFSRKLHGAFKLEAWRLLSTDHVRPCLVDKAMTGGRDVAADQRRQPAFNRISADESGGRGFAVGGR